MILTGKDGRPEENFKDDGSWIIALSFYLIHFAPSAINFVFFAILQICQEAEFRNMDWQME